MATSFDSRELTIIDPNGDVVLEVGGGDNNDHDEEENSAVFLKVSSKLLSLASPVFCAMFKPHFVEGYTLQSTGVVNIKLPDDGPEATLWVMKALHFCPDLNPPTNLDFVYNVGVVGDKYAMITGMSAWLWHLMSKLDKKSIIQGVSFGRKSDFSEKNIRKLMWLAFVCNDCQVFHDTTRKMLLHTAGMQFELIGDYAKSSHGTIDRVCGK